MTVKNVLFVASEASPLVKVGGLADVVGALPGALKNLAVDARILIPKYGTIPNDHLSNLQSLLRAVVDWQGRKISVELFVSALPGTDTILYLLDAPEFFADGGVYYEHDEKNGARLAMERFVFFSWAVAHIIPKLPWQPDLIHCHDWHTAAIPAFLSMIEERAQPTVLTIHNIEGQGKWTPDDVFGWLNVQGKNVPPLHFRDQSGNLNLLQLGIRNASVVNTVSPTYAHEILTSAYGLGLESDLGQRSGGVSGIVNGIDYQAFNPAADATIFAKYDATTAAVGKVANKRALLAELELESSGGPLFVAVGRFTGQKGVDLIPDSLSDIVQAGGRVVLLGSGVPQVEQAIAAAVAPFPKYCRVIVKFDAKLAQRMYAAADFFLMPSRFEPCGLGQLIAMRYGALPIVRDTGGLHDTVHDLRRRGGGTGLVFGPATAVALQTAVSDALRIFNQPDTMKAARQRAMDQDFSWSRSAQDYLNLYTNAK